MNPMIGLSIYLVITGNRPKFHYRSSEALQIFQGVARWIPRAISPFMDLHGAMCAALPSEDEYVFCYRNFIYALTTLTELTRTTRRTLTES
jgi:hypothetical protein